MGDEGWQGNGPAGPDLLRCPQVQLALLLREAGVMFTIVGGTARFLLGAPRRPRDLDVVVQSGNLPALCAALALRGGRRSPLRSAHPSPQRVSTAWSKVDVFVQDAVPACIDVVIDGVIVQVASD